MLKDHEIEILRVFQACESYLLTSLGFPNDETISWAISSCEANRTKNKHQNGCFKDKDKDLVLEF